VKAAIAMVIAATAAGLVIAAACGSTPVITVGATFKSPSSVAATWAEDRDLIFEADVSVTGRGVGPRSEAPRFELDPRLVEEAPEEGEKDSDEAEHIPAKAGPNLFVWDLRYEPPVKIPAAIYDEGDPVGPLVMPGSYQARLTVAGKTSTAAIEVKMDPRLKTSTEDLQKQFDLLMKIRDKQGKRSVEISDVHGHTTIEHQDGNPHMEKDELLNRMSAALDELNVEQKQCIILFYLDKRSYQEIADTTGFTLMQVKSYIQNGKRNLKLILEKKNKVGK